MALQTSNTGSMSDVGYLILRRMRVPLIVIVVIFAVCVAGLAVMPGVDADGNPAPSMTMFEAFYVISYTATTIGFGEIPSPYSTSQRLWMTLSIYLSVVGWTYALVTILALVQEQGFQNALRMGRFSRRISHLREPFYIVCGAGETGSLVCHSLDRLAFRYVVIENDAVRLQEFRLEEFRSDAPMVVADAAQPSALRQAGLLSPHCKGVMALTDDDATNQAIAVTTRLLAPKVGVLARIRDVDTDTHVGVFGGDLVINPFERFAEHLAAAVAAPQRYRLREILTGLPGEPLPEHHRPPRGHWIVCGYGRFGQAVVEAMRAAGNTVAVIDRKFFEEGGGVDVFGTGTDAESLTAAGIDHAVGIVAGNASDTKNLAIAVTARDLNPSVFVVTRQNQNANSPLFEAFVDDLAMRPSWIVAHEFLARITTPQLSRFLSRLVFHSEADAAELQEELERVGRGVIPDIWSFHVTERSAEAVTAVLEGGGVVTVGDLMRNPSDRDRRVRAKVLMVSRLRKNFEDVADDFEVHRGDEILFAGNPRSKSAIELTLRNANALTYALGGSGGSGGFVWQWLTRRRERRAEAAAVSERTGVPEPS